PHPRNEPAVAGSLRDARLKEQRPPPRVMPALVAGIHAGTTARRQTAWMAGTNPAMTRGEVALHGRAAARPVRRVERSYPFPLRAFALPPTPKSSLNVART